MTTKTAGHTPGPWARDSKGDLRGTNGEPIYFQRADGDLMQAAPELLEALEGLINAIDKLGFTTAKHDGYFESAWAAIRKARGE